MFWVQTILWDQTLTTDVDIVHLGILGVWGICPSPGCYSGLSGESPVCPWVAAGSNGLPTDCWHAQPCKSCLAEWATHTHHTSTFTKTFLNLDSITSSSSSCYIYIDRPDVLSTDIPGARQGLVCKNCKVCLARHPLAAHRPPPTPAHVLGHVLCKIVEIGHCWNCFY